MKICPSCNAVMEDTATFCTKCGTKLEPSQTETSGSADAAENRTGQTYGGGFQNYQSDAQSWQNSAQNYQNSSQNYQNGPMYAPPADPYDHTAEFTQKDISDNKVVAMLVYLLGTMGIIIALLGSQSSPYAAFHVRQALKFTVISVLMGLITVFLCWTIIVPIAALIAYIVLFVVKIICFFSICKGQAKEPPILRSFGFLR